MPAIIELQRLFELWKTLQVEDSFKDWAKAFKKRPKKRQEKQFEEYGIVRQFHNWIEVVSDYEYQRTYFDAW